VEFKELEEKFKEYTLKLFKPEYGELTAHPHWKLVVLTCIDCRIAFNAFGIYKPGLAKIIRNAGALLTQDSLRSMLVAIYALKADIVAVIGHTDCGGQMSSEQMERLMQEIVSTSNLTYDEALQLLKVSSAEEFFLGFNDTEDQIRETVNLIKTNPLIPKEVKVRGYIYNTRDGTINRV
jgi:carbonic anhydrase